ncbi:sensor histidine kinase [Rathayibacter sp. VKM Ac-2803]|uniref:sensor histidine kinase n=1 Tax=Rathayibacter sp. VKM Ac-2803 TaxID=2609256 RepID=UPI00135C93DA|nr:histidine kinase [Rathayibacter sp. VKM Ac-2803]
MSRPRTPVHTTPWLDRRSAGPILLAANLAVGLAIFALVAPRLPLWNLLLTLAIGLGAILPLGWQRRRPRTAGVAACLGAALTPIATPALWTALVLIGRRLPARTAWRFVAAGALADAFLLGLFIVRWARPEILGASILVGLFSVAVTVTIGVLGILTGAKRRSEREADRRLISALDRERTALARSLDAERERIAEEIHDSLGHSLTLLSLHSAALRDLDGLSPEEVRILTESIDRQTRTAIDSLTATLRAAPVAGSTEAAADLDRLFSDVTSTGRELDVRIDGDPGALDTAATAALVRFCREGLTNALKHAAAGPLVVAVRVDDDGSVVAAVTSPGGEATAGAASTTRGLSGLRESTATLGGEVVLTPGRDQTVLSLRVPAPGARDSA